MRGYVQASDGAKAEEVGLLAALVADPSLLVAVRKQYGTWQDRVAARAATRWTPPWPGSPRTGCGWPSSSACAPPTGELRERVLERLLDDCAIDSSVNALGSARTSVPT